MLHWLMYWLCNRGDRVVRWCRVNFQCRGVLSIWIIIGQGPTVLAVGAGGSCLDFFLSSIISLFFLPLFLWETARYRLKYCLKGPLSPKQPTNQNRLCNSPADKSSSNEIILPVYQCRFCIFTILFHIIQAGICSCV